MRNDRSRMSVRHHQNLTRSCARGGRLVGGVSAYQVADHSGVRGMGFFYDPDDMCGALLCKCECFEAILRGERDDGKVERYKKAKRGCELWACTKQAGAVHGEELTTESAAFSIHPGYHPGVFYIHPGSEGEQLPWVESQRPIR